MNEQTKRPVWRILFTVLSLAAGGVFFAVAQRTGILAMPVVIGVVLLAYTAGIFFLTGNGSRIWRIVTAAVLLAAQIAFAAAGSYLMLTWYSALHQITEPTGEQISVGVYVRAEDAAQMPEEIRGDAMGVLTVQGRDAVNMALKQIGYDGEIKEYDDPESLMDALFAGEIRFIIADEAFLELLSDSEGHETDLQKVRRIRQLTFDASEIVPTSTDPKPKPEPTEPEPEEEPLSNKRKVFTCYISGIDCFGSVSKRSRSDVNILATVNVETGEVLLVSTPRDFYVPTSVSNGVPDKLTNAGIYGIQCSMDTLGMLYGVEVDYYFRMNFDGFKDIIDALGGITVHSDYTFSVGNFHYVKGENTLNAEEALAFARERHAFADGDRQRGRDQMEVIKAVVQKLVSPAILTNYKEILDSLSQAFETNMPYDMIMELIRNQLSKGTSWHITTHSANGHGASLKPYSQKGKAYVMIPDQTTVDKAKELMAQVARPANPGE